MSMVMGYRYDLWNGKEIVGTHYRSSPILYGRNIVLDEVPIFKQLYGKRQKTIVVPVYYQEVSDDGVTITIRRVLDVRKKSKRQIEILKKRSGGL